MPLIIGQKGSSRCCCGDCRGFPAFDGSHRFFRYATVYDYDCCQFAQCVDDSGLDGKVKFESTGCGYGIVVESTGNYLKSFRDGECIDCKSLYPIDTIREMLPGLLNNPYIRCSNYFATTPGIINPTKATARYDNNCCNAAGDKIYWELTEEITDGTCNKMGACCGYRSYGVTNGVSNASGNIDDKTTCRMCHECECDTAKGEVWHGEGSSCESNPCCCQGFQAFDGSFKFYRYAKYFDNDICYFTSDKNDGYYVVKWNGSPSNANTAACGNSGVIVEVNGGQRRYRKEGDCETIPYNAGFNVPANSATFRSFGISSSCGNPLGDKVGWMLYDEIPCSLSPLP